MSISEQSTTPLQDSKIDVTRVRLLSLMKRHVIRFEAEFVALDPHQISSPSYRLNDDETPHFLAVAYCVHMPYSAYCLVLHSRAPLKTKIQEMFG